MKFKFHTILVITTVFASTCLADYTIAIDGGPDAGGNFEPAAPIYTLNGSAHADLDIFTSEVTVTQDLTFSMDNVNGGNVRTTGDVMITKEGSWDATFLANSTYKIATYGNFINVSFNHTLNKDPSEDMLVDGEICDSGFVTSRGSMALLADYSFAGSMSGVVVAKKNGSVVRNYRYNDNFTQEFTDVAIEDQGIWSAEYEVTELPKNKLGGSGTIEVGPAGDPVDSVDQTVKGSQKGGVLSWSTTSVSKADSKVKVTIKHTATDLVKKNKPNSVSAAAQTRKF